jgi:hypothetical protein
MKHSPFCPAIEEPRSFRVKLMFLLSLLACFILTGCVSPFTKKIPITRAYAPQAALTENEAVLTLDNICKQQKRKPIDGHTIFETVDRTGLQAVTYRESFKQTGTTWTYYYSSGASIPTANFASQGFSYQDGGKCEFKYVDKIQLLIYPDHNAVRFHVNHKNYVHGWLIAKLVCEKDPAEYNRVVSALLTLCPNVK